MLINRRQAGACLAGLALAACGKKSEETGATNTVKVNKESFGKLSDGREVDIYTLSNGKGLVARVMNQGAIVQSVKVPDKSGNVVDVVLGFDNLDGYLQKNPYFGAIVGRYGNRIGSGKFALDGKTYNVVVNDGKNSLHGGNIGFDKKYWGAREVPNGVEFTTTSADGDQGYPGNLTAKVTYTVTPDNGLRIDYTATSDKDTVVNLTNHSYWNLSGQGNGLILDHEMMIDADRFTPVDAGLIPTGELKPVEGTPFDFRQPTAIGARINEDNEQLKLGGGYDHNWVLNRKGGSVELAARAHDPKTGRVLEVLTDQPGVQFYTGNFLDGSVKGKGGIAYPKRSAFCLETQHFPDSPNHPDFPSTELKAGQEYKTTTIFRFPAA